MKLEVEITKFRFFAIFGALLFIAALIGVTAFSSTGTGGTPSTFGHSIDEIDWTKNIPGLKVSSLNASQVNATSLCISGDCKTNWNQVGGSGTLNVTRVLSSFAISPVGSSLAIAYCPAEYTMILGGGCDDAEDSRKLTSSQPTSFVGGPGNNNLGWECDYRTDGGGSGDSTITVTVFALCGKMD